MWGLAGGSWLRKMGNTLKLSTFFYLHIGVEVHIGYGIDTVMSWNGTMLVFMDRWTVPEGLEWGLPYGVVWHCRALCFAVTCLGIDRGAWLQFCRPGSM